VLEDRHTPEILCTQNEATSHIHPHDLIQMNVPTIGIRLHISRLIPIALSVLLFAGCAGVAAEGGGPARSEAPKNIILFIGDGMGPAQLTAATFLRDEMNMARMPVGGLILTSSNDRITDSAAGATALATGRVTNNRMLSISPEGDPYRLITEAAQEMGMRTGVVATSRVVHATPAAFAVSNVNRRAEHEIAAQFLNAPLDLILAGGTNQFLPEEEGGEREDGRDITAEMQERGFSYFDDIGRISETETEDKVLGLFVPQNFEPYPDRGEITTDLTRAAIANLSRSDNGFFLMVEGSQIDWAGHDNLADWMAQEVLDLDNAVGAALDFAERDGNTLVVVTADHETGGYTLLRDRSDAQSHEDHFSTGYHSASAVPIFASGPSAQRFGGLMHQSRVGQLFFEILGEGHPNFEPGAADRQTGRP